MNRFISVCLMVMLGMPTAPPVGVYIEGTLRPMLNRAGLEEALRPLSTGLEEISLDPILLKRLPKYLQDFLQNDFIPLYFPKEEGYWEELHKRIRNSPLWRYTPSEAQEQYLSIYEAAGKGASRYDLFRWLQNTFLLPRGVTFVVGGNREDREIGRQRGVRLVRAYGYELYQTSLSIVPIPVIYIDVDFSRASALANYSTAFVTLQDSVHHFRRLREEELIHSVDHIRFSGELSRFTDDIRSQSLFGGTRQKDAIPLLTQVMKSKSSHFRWEFFLELRAFLMRFAGPHAKNAYDSLVKIQMRKKEEVALKVYESSYKFVSDWLDKFHPGDLSSVNSVKKIMPQVWSELFPSDDPWGLNLKRIHPASGRSERIQLARLSGIARKKFYTPFFQFLLSQNSLVHQVNEEGHFLVYLYPNGFLQRVFQLESGMDDSYLEQEASSFVLHRNKDGLFLFNQKEGSFEMMPANLDKNSALRILPPLPLNPLFPERIHSFLEAIGLGLGVSTIEMEEHEVPDFSEQEVAPGIVRLELVDGRKIQVVVTENDWRWEEQSKAAGLEELLRRFPPELEWAA